VKKALERSLDSKPNPSTSVFGELFEALIIQEVFRLNHYFNLDWRMSYFKTKNNAEVDLILTKGRRTLLIEIKSYDKKDSKDIAKLSRLAADFKAQCYLVSRDSLEEKDDHVTCWPWQKFLKSIQKL